MPGSAQGNFDLVGPDDDLLGNPVPSRLPQAEPHQSADCKREGGQPGNQKFRNGNEEGNGYDGGDNKGYPAARGPQRPVGSQRGGKERRGGCGLHRHGGLSKNYWQRFEGERMATAKKVKKLGRADAEAIFTRFHEIEPEPKGELDYVNAYTLLVAVVLSAQATDVGVNRATKNLFQIAPTPAAMVALGVEGIENEIKTIGLFRNKAKFVFALSQQLIEK